MAIAPLGEWLPDLPALGNPGMPAATNVIPITAKSYGPFLTLGGEQFASALPGECVGAFSTPDTGRAFRIIAATAAPKLLNAQPPLGGGAASWTDNTPSGLAPPSLPAPFNRWRFTRFNTTLIAVQWDNQPQSIGLDAVSLSGGTYSNLAAYNAGSNSGAPGASYVAASLKGFLILGDIWWPPQNSGASTPTRYPNRVWWSGVGNAALWPEVGTATAIAQQSAYVDLPGDLGAVQGLVPNLPSADCLVFMEHGIVRMTYVGGGPVWDFSPVSGAMGALAPDSIVKVGNIVYYLGEDGFYACDGINIIPIGAQKIDAWFLGSNGGFEDGKLNIGANTTPFGFQDWPNKAIRWRFPSGNNGFDTELYYSWVLQRWGNGQNLPASEWGLSAFDAHQQYRAVGFDSTHTPWAYKGSVQAASMSTAETQLFPGRRSFVRGVRPLIDGGSPTVALSTRQNQTDAQTVGSAVAQDASGTCPQRADARFVQATIAVGAAASWTEATGFDIDAVPSGLR